MYSQCESNLGDRDGSQLDLFLGSFRNYYSEFSSKSIQLYENRAFPRAQYFTENRKNRLSMNKIKLRF